MTTCPHCNAAMKLGKREEVLGMVSRYRRCRSCSFTDRAFYEPEKLIRTESVRQRTKSIPTGVVPAVDSATIQECQT